MHCVFGMPGWCFPRGCARCSLFSVELSSSARPGDEACPFTSHMCSQGSVSFSGGHPITLNLTLGSLARNSVACTCFPCHIKASQHTDLKETSEVTQRGLTETPAGRDYGGLQGRPGSLGVSATLQPPDTCSSCSQAGMKWFPSSWGHG